MAGRILELQQRVNREPDFEIFTECLYLAESQDGSILKIGISRDPLTRMRVVVNGRVAKKLNLKRGMVLLGCLVGTRAEEFRITRTISEFFSPAYGYEWFYSSPKLKAHLLRKFNMSAEEAIRQSTEIRESHLVRSHFIYSYYSDPTAGAAEGKR